MSTIPGPKSGTVAARVQAFQDGHNIEEHTPDLNRVPRVMTHANDFGVTIGQGRREDTAFASPAGRVSRDGVEGIRGDGRPPVGSFQRRTHPSLEEKEVCYISSPQLSSSRPVTSIAWNGIRHQASNAMNEHQANRLGRRKYISMENITDAGSEITLARSRLRTIAENKTSGSSNSPERKNTMSELGYMLDNAIVENTIDRSANGSTDLSGMSTPQLSPIRFWKSDRVPKQAFNETSVLGRGLKHGNPPDQMPTTFTKSSDNDFFKQAENMESRYEMPKPLSSSESKSSGSAIKDQNTEFQKRNDTYMRVSKISEKRTGRDRSESQYIGQLDQACLQDTTQPIPSRSIESTSQPLSPVKMKAALYENMGEPLPLSYKKSQAFPNQKSSISRGNKHELNEQTDDPNYKLKHDLRIEGTTNERTTSPLMPLALPRLITSKRQSIPTSIKPSTETDETFITAQQSSNVTDAGEETEAEQSSKTIRDIRIKPSITWPFKWTLFNRSTSMPPPVRESEVTSEIDPSEDRPITKPSIVQNRIQDLLAAANKPAEREQLTRQASTEKRSQQNSDDSNTIIERKLRGSLTSLESLAPQQLPPLQIPIQEENAIIRRENDDRHEADHRNLSPAKGTRISPVRKPRTPFRGSTVNRERIGGPTILSEQLSNNNDHDNGPSLSNPTTPVRGRSSRRTNHASPGISHHSVEQRFALGSGSNRSQSAGVKVELEVRDSPDREARDRGEKIVIVRANFDSMEDT